MIPMRRLQPYTQIVRIAFAALLLVSKQASAQDQPLQVPEQLKPWLNWVQDREPELRCPLVGEARQCFWPGHLAVTADPSGATFTLQSSLDRNGALVLPGDAEVWPQEVEVRSTPGIDPGKVSVRLVNEHPTIELASGTYEVKGRFAWTAMPETLAVPPQIGAVELTVAGAKIERPEIDEQGELWLGAKEDESETSEATSQPDAFAVRVSRLFSDGSPFAVTTRLHLEVTGKARKILLPSFALAGSEILVITADLPHFAKPDGSLELSVRSGEFDITATSMFSVPPEKLAAPPAAGSEWAAQEYWAWSANAEIRTARVSGIPAVDPSHTWLPAEWQSFPAYVAKAGAVATFETLRRGQTEVPPNQLTVGRSLWMASSGAAELTASDTFSGMLHSGWRLDTLPGTELTRASIGVTPLLVTQNPQDPAKRGAEIRASSLQPPHLFAAVSKVPLASQSIDAVGWDVSAQHLDFQLHLPPNRMLIHASGPDSIHGTWIETWTIGEIGTGLLLALIFFKLFGLLGLGLALGCFALAHQTAPHDDIWWPQGAWILLLAALGVRRFANRPAARTFALWCWVPAAVFAAMVVGAFGLHQLKLALFPFAASELPTSLVYWQPPSHLFSSDAVATFVSTLLEGPLGIAVLFGIVFTWLLAGLHRRYKLVAAMALVIGAAFFLSSRGSAPRSMSYDMVSASGGAGSAVKQMMSPPAAKPATAMRQKTLASPAPMVGRGKREQFQELRADAPVAQSAFGALDSAEVESAPAEGSAGLEEALSNDALLDSSVSAAQPPGEIDPQAVAQTGIAIPMWRGSIYSLQFDGTVQKDQKVSLCVAGPFAQRVLRLASALFAFGLLWLLLRRFQTPLTTISAVLLCMMTALLPHSADAQETPSAELLNELQARYSETVCKSDCAFASALHLEVSGTRATITAEVASRGTGAWPLPGPLSELYPQTISIDGAAAAGLFRSDSGFLWIRIPNGKHKIVVEGLLADKNSVGVAFEQRPGHVSANARGWEADGISETGYVEGVISLSRTGADDRNSGAEPGAAAPTVAAFPQWLRVQRVLDFGVQWRVTTFVTRLGQTERAESVPIPLLAGERLLTRDLKVENGAVTVTFQRDENSTSFSSALDPGTPVALKAGGAERQSEDWVLRCSALWRCEPAGLTPTSTFDGRGPVYRWLPMNGESVSISATKPIGVSGATKTIDRVEYLYNLSARTADVQTQFWLRTSSGSQEEIGLPAGAILKNAILNGVELGQPLKDSKLTVDFAPGNHQVTINWQLPQTGSFRQVVPTVQFQTAPFNVLQSLTTRQERVIVALTGTEWKTYLEYWFHLAALLALAGFAAWKCKLPLSGLGCGMAALLCSFCGWQLAFHLVIWIAAYEYRRRTQPSGAFAFNVWQVCLALLTIASAIAIFQGVQFALQGLANTQMNPTLDGYRVLAWYAEHGATMPPSAIYSVPRWVIRAIVFGSTAGLGISLYRMVPYLKSVLLQEGLWRWPRKSLNSGPASS